MVLVDGVKYACQACIKGHRSSKCTHTDRELTEIKSAYLSLLPFDLADLICRVHSTEKGRPTSQCNHCRELRKTRSVHGKCDCVGANDSKGLSNFGSLSLCLRSFETEDSTVSPDVKPSAKVLPNGLIDIIKQNEPSKDSKSENLKSGGQSLLSLSC